MATFSLAISGLPSKHCVRGPIEMDGAAPDVFRPPDVEPVLKLVAL